MSTKMTVVAALLALHAIGGEGALAKDKTTKIGVLTDQSGLYADAAGLGSVLAAQMAVEDSGLNGKGWKIEVIDADHQNKADIAASISRKWIDTANVDVIADGNSSAVGLAINQIAKDKNKIFLSSGTSTSELTNAHCTPNTIHWTYDTYMLANGTGTAMTRAGGNTWFFLSADYTFGTILERDTTAAISAVGGKVLGSVRHPLNTSDFSSFLLQAQASKAKVIGLANAGNDTTNAIKQAAEFGITSQGQSLAGLLLFLSDIHSLGLKAAQGIVLTESFYWDLNGQTHAFSKRFAERMKNKTMPTMVHAGVYAAVIHYLKVLEAAEGNSRDGAKIVEAMKELPTDDPLFGKGSIQPNGRKIHPAYLFEVKKPEESKGPWDYYKLISTIPADQAFTPLDKSVCPLVKK